MKKILTVGSINMDLVFSVDQLPQKGQTIMGNSFETHHGGKGANQAYIIGKLGGNSEMIGVVGKDAYGEELIAGLDEVGIMTKNIGFSKNPTGTANIIVDSNGDNTIVVTSGANFDYSTEFIKEIKKIIDQVEYLILQFEIPYDVVKELAIYAHKNHKIVVLNPAPARKLDSELLANIDYLIPNETELGVITGKYVEPNPKEVARIAKVFKSENKINNMVVTLGSKGSVWVDEQNQDHFIPTTKVNAIDSTGAGDSYLGAFVWALSQDWEVKKALEFAAKVGAIVVTRKGAQDSMPSLKEVNEFQV